MYFMMIILILSIINSLSLIFEILKIKIFVGYLVLFKKLVYIKIIVRLFKDFVIVCNF